MSNLVVSESQGEWDMQCTGDFRETKRTLAIGDPGKDGFAILRVTEKSIDSQNVLKAGDDCVEVVAEPKVQAFDLSFDGSQYVVPKELAF